MRFGKSLLALKFELNHKVNKDTDSEEYYEEAPLCKYANGGCICIRQLKNGPVKCFYKKGPSKCCFEKEEPKEILDKSRTYWYGVFLA